MKQLKFNLNINEPLKKLQNIALERFPDSEWTLRAFYWEDGTFDLELSYGGDEALHCFCYDSTKNEYKYLRKFDVINESWDNLVPEILEV